MKRLFGTAILTAAMLASIFTGRAQAVQEGTVVEMNSGNKPIAGVAITVVGAIPADSDSEGRFRLVFSRSKPGAKVVANNIHKEGYEIVNDTEVRSWVLSEKEKFRIVMCQKGKLEESRRNFYDIGQDRYYSLFNSARTRLAQQKEASRLTEQQYADSLDILMMMYDDNMRRLDYYADKFSRINKDDLNEMDARALELMESGFVEEAIAVYEEADILRVFRDKTVQADTLTSNIALLTKALANQARLLISSGDAGSFAKADSILQVIHVDSPVDPHLTLEIAEMLISMDEHQKAYELLSDALTECRDTGSGEKIASLLTDTATLLENAVPGGNHMQKALALISDWRYDRSLRNLD